MQGNNPLRLKDNYDEQVQHIQALCNEASLVDIEMGFTLKFAYQPQGPQDPQGPTTRWRTLGLKERIVGALEDLDIVYTLIQDPESSAQAPVYFLMFTAVPPVALAFYQAIGHA